MEDRRRRRVSVREHAVLPRPLRRIQRGVGPPQERLPPLRLPRKGGDPSRDRGERLPAPVAQQSAPHPLRNEQRGLAPSVDEHRELLAADPEDAFVGAHAAAEDDGDPAQDLVALLVAARVVQPLEVVEVEQDEAERVVARDRRLEPLLEGAPVRKPGQHVAPRLRAAESQRALVRERGSREIRHRCEQRLVERVARPSGHDQRAERVSVREQRQREDPLAPHRLSLLERTAGGVDGQSGDAARWGAGRARRSEPSRAGADVDRRQLGPRQVGELTRDELRLHALAERPGERVREPDERVAGADDRPLELPGGDALDAVRARAGLHHRHDDPRVVRAGEGDDPRRPQELPHLPRRSNAVEDGHPDVHQDHVRLELPGQVDGLPAVPRLAHDLDLGAVGEVRPHELARLHGIVCDQEADHRLRRTRRRGSASLARARRFGGRPPPRGGRAWGRPSGGTPRRRLRGLQRAARRSERT